MKHKCSEHMDRIMEETMVRRLGGEAEATSGEWARLERHLESCPGCREHYLELEMFYGDIAVDSATMTADMAKINWEENAAMIAAAAQIRKNSRRRSQNVRWGWLPAGPVFTAIFILGVGLGYLLFHQGTSAPASNSPNTLQPAAREEMSLAHLETTLARRDLQDYFRKSHMLITDLMRRCDANTPSFRESDLNRRQIRLLLNKQNYFSKDLQDPQLQSVRPIMTRIEWLLLEMLTLDEDFSCEKLNRLQDYVRKEQLLFKLRLAGKEIGYNEV